MSSKTIKPGEGFDLENPNLSFDDDGPVECLGKTFENDTARREHYLVILAEKLKDPEFRKIEGFPIGEDEDILNLSDPPYYTACPNPFLREISPSKSVENYSRIPYAFDVKEGRHEPIYLAHTYHAKVPYRAVMRYILAYTDPGDLVLDGFSGSGMSGVAASFCENIPSDIAEELQADSIVYKEGARRSVISDLSPAATFISSNYNVPSDAANFRAEAEDLLSKVYDQLGWMYQTTDNAGNACEVKYFVWSDIFSCPSCTEELTFYDAAYDRATKKFSDEFDCASCGVRLKKKDLKRVYEKYFDVELKSVIERAKQKIVLRSYVDSSGRRLHEKPIASDFSKYNLIEESGISTWFPNEEIPYMHMTHERNNLPSIGVTHAHHFYTRRNLATISMLVALAKERPQPIRRSLLFWITSCLSKMSRLMNYNADGIGRVTKGIFFFSSISQEASPFHFLTRAIGDVEKCFRALDNGAEQSTYVSNNGAQSSFISDESIDYIFTDPPFGENIYYSDLNYLWEVWLRVKTNVELEAIVSKTEKKGCFCIFEPSERLF